MFLSGARSNWILKHIGPIILILGEEKKDYKLVKVNKTIILELQPLTVSWHSKNSKIDSFYITSFKSKSSNIF